MRVTGMSPSPSRTVISWKSYSHVCHSPVTLIFTAMRSRTHAVGKHSPSADVVSMHWLLSPNFSLVRVRVRESEREREREEREREREREREKKCKTTPRFNSR